ncbi:branched-chain amino acid aminotransferase [Sporosarcina sp. CAU 1771]
MLKKQMEQYFAKNLNEDKIELFDIEKDFAEEHQMLTDGIFVSSKEFHFQVIERCDKETEELLHTETSDFLKQAISHLTQHRNEFVYVESTTLELIRVDAIALELDDVFKTYTALLGLRLQKKYGPEIKAYLDANLQGEGVKYSVMFSDADGLWDINFALDYVEGFNDTLSFDEAYQIIYTFIFNLIRDIE